VALAEYPEVEGHLACIRSAMLHALREQVLLGQSIAGVSDLAGYLKLEMAHQTLEQLRVIFLAPGNRMLSDEVMAQGSVDSAPLLARPIVTRALELGASGLILVHNHPGGDPKPSSADLKATRRLMETCTALDIQVHDHLIVARGGWTSLRLEGLM
jgi:DNA repair protein RadC